MSYGICTSLKCSNLARNRVWLFRAFMADSHGRTAAASFDREAFRTTLRVPALRIPIQKCSEMMRVFHGTTLDRPKMRCIVPDGDRKDTKLLLLEENVNVETLAEPLQSVIRDNSFEASQYDVQIDYSFFTSDRVLRKLLPADVEVPTSFECVGHIAHLNLREEHLPYKHIIGQVILDKNPNLRTVVNKVGAIESEYRVFQMEVLAGERCLETEVQQHGARFVLDFSQVYWNSRLETEHTRLVSTYFQPGQVVLDMTAGIGPFAVPAAQKGCTVYANDLNPRSVHFLRRNIRLNRVSSSVHAFNMDARGFVRLLLATPGGPADSLEELRAAAPPPPPPPLVVVPSGSDAGGGVEAGGEAQGSGMATGGSGRPAGTAEAAEAGPSASSGSKAAGNKSSGSRRGGGRKGAAAEDEEVGVLPSGFTGPPERGLVFQHAVSNLPASGIEFLDAFNGAFDPEQYAGSGTGGGIAPLPMVHCYTFKKAAETEEDIIRKAEHYLGGKLDSTPTVHVVRDVAPNKIMLCLSFQVPAAVAFNGRGATGAAAGASPVPAGDAKRQKTSE